MVTKPARTTLKGSMVVKRNAVSRPRIPHQPDLTTFWGQSPAAKRPRKSEEPSSFVSCPLCNKAYPLHHIEGHAASCQGLPEKPPRLEKPTPVFVKEDAEPIPGLFLFQNFVSEEEEAQILAELDGADPQYALEFLPWNEACFNGAHLGKRWGVHCDLRSRRVGAAEHPLPHFMHKILLPKLARLKPMSGCTPNEANAIDYRKASGHFLVGHVDDRKLSKEPIANLSLAGDCYMEFRNVAAPRNVAVLSKKVLLRRRTLVVLTGKARYDFSHGIAPEDLLAARRVSVTMRESPLTHPSSQENSMMPRRERSRPSLSQPKLSTTNDLKLSWVVPSDLIRFTVSNPLPGLFLFEEFVTLEEEALILAELDDPAQLPVWNNERHTGTHREKRWGVDHDLWSQAIRRPRYELPAFVRQILLPKLQKVAVMQGCIPNEVNALDYRRKLGHSLKHHVDDRQKHKEPIANLSLVGDCYMTYQNQAAHRNSLPGEKRILLRRRCLQVLTGKARYEFAHGIHHDDFLSDRRVSVTMRETPMSPIVSGPLER